MKARRDRSDRSKQTSRTEQQQRARIAQAAAALILEHGLADWRYAKRKAARQLLLPENAALPGDDEIEAALFEHQALFGGEAHISQLRTRRLQALAWMDRLAAFSPKLYGSLAEGWGGEHQDIRLELIADDPKVVELRLIDIGIRYHPVPTAAPAECITLRADDGVSETLLHIETPTTRQQRSKSPRRMLDRAALIALLEKLHDEAEAPFSPHF